MCGIYAAIGQNRVDPVHDVAHRGPDDFQEITYKDCDMKFWRLAINGDVGGEQPMYNGNRIMVCNGEIYNYLELGGRYGASDCEIIMPLIGQLGMTRALECMNGDFAFVISDGKNSWAARDRVGVRPLFYVRYSGGIAFASEAKSLMQYQERIDQFPPGHFYDSNFDQFFCYAPMYYPGSKHKVSTDDVMAEIQDKLIAAVKIRMETTERPVGYFLSGGLDSSLIAAIAADLSDKPIKTFSIGFEGQDSPDLKAARVVANYINSDHTEVTFSLQEGLDAIKDVIWHLESFDTTTIRASVPMFLLSKYISENTDIKVVLSGEGADELFGGYLYFHNAPNVTKFALETNRLVLDVHLFDVLRADRCTSAHGIELRVPFFDPDFIEYVMDGFQPGLKRTKLEKMILRQAFDGFLPNEILYRQKNGMSDAVGYGWVDGIKAYCNSRWFQRTEEKYYKKIFNSHFGTFMEHLTPYMWLPKWSGNITDPSARQLSVFSS